MKPSKTLAAVILMIAIGAPAGLALIVFGPTESINALGTNGMLLVLGAFTSTSVVATLVGRWLRSDTKESMLFSILRELGKEPEQTDKRGRSDARTTAA